ncbi:hypothetical protein KY289_023971 [Solanum tuberosum]|nr:hypothetical protein KY289_023971 [Solanum tuberosum]
MKKDLVGREVTVELNNDLAIQGTLHSVDQYLNIRLENTRVVDEDKYPHMICDSTISWFIVVSSSTIYTQELFTVHLRIAHIKRQEARNKMLHPEKILPSEVQEQT